MIKDARETRKILKERARLLALEPLEKEPHECIEVVEFQLAGEKYCIESIFVREVYQPEEITPLPCTPSFVSGIINARGQIVSVIDIKKFWNLPEKNSIEPDKVIIIRNDKMEFGILADEIIGVRSIPACEIQTTIPALTGVRAEYLKGITKERLAVLDAGKILNDRGIIVNEHI